MRESRRRALLCLALLSALLGQTAWAQDVAPGEAPADAPLAAAEFGGPTSVPNQILLDAPAKGPVYRGTLVRRALCPWYQWKGNLASRYGLQLAGDYTLLAQHLTESPGERSAAGAIARLYGTWNLVNRGCPNSGALIFKVESRYAMTDVAPLALGFETGYLGVTGPPFSDIGGAVTNLYWRQRFANDRISVVAGILDATDFLDVYGLINPWTSFQNLAFLTNPTIAVPNQGLGIAAGAYLSKNIYAMAGVEDANGDPTREPFTSFFEDAEYFKHVELGWTSGKERFFLDNVHVTAWHADERTMAGVEESWGVAASAAFFVCDRWMPFVRAGWAEGTAPVWDRSVSVGLGRYFSPRSDLAALGVSWGRPSGTRIDDQFTIEGFYRLQLLQSLAITPSLQLLVNPATNPEEDVVGLLGFRFRLTF